MTKNDKQEFAKAMTACYMAFDKQLDANQMGLYFEMLSDYNVNQVTQAFKAHMKDPDRGRFFPKIADVIYQIIGTEKQRSELQETTAELEWAKIYAAASNGAEPRNISVEARSALRSLGGVNKVGYTLEKDIPFLKREFMALHKSIVGCTSDQLDSSLPLYSELVSKKNQVAIK
jgi:hypothetical protein